jgi:hypothetical protein
MDGQSLLNVSPCPVLSHSFADIAFYPLNQKVTSSAQATEADFLSWVDKSLIYSGSLARSTG